MAWITADDLRSAAGAKQAFDQDRFEEAAEIACDKVEELCGPITWATITAEHVEVAGSDRVCLGASVTRGLVTVADYLTGSAYTLTDWDWDGQVLFRKDRAPIYRDLSVTYQTGYYDDTVDGAKAPAWARGMAKIIGLQYLRVVKRFVLGEDVTTTAFIVPDAALILGHDYLIVQGRVGNG